MPAASPFRRALERTLGTLALLVGSALPFALAWVLVASTNEEAAPQNPLERIPNYSGPLEETLSVPAGDAVQTAYTYRGTVRLIVEGQWGEGAALCDALYCFSPNSAARWRPSLRVDGAALEEVAMWDGQTPPAPDPREHTYTALYGVGERWRALRLQNTAEAGALRVTVLQQP